MTARAITLRLAMTQNQGTAAQPTVVRRPSVT